jgi:hypothetical protein
VNSSEFWSRVNLLPKPKGDDDETDELQSSMVDGADWSDAKHSTSRSLLALAKENLCIHLAFV